MNGALGRIDFTRNAVTHISVGEVVIKIPHEYAWPALHVMPQCFPGIRAVGLRRNQAHH